MKDNLFHSIWTAVNTALICLVAGWVNVSLYIPEEIGKKVDNMRIELDAYEKSKQDTILIHIDNQINIPKSIRITK